MVGYSCIHGGYFKSKSKGIRHVSNNFLGCTWKLTLNRQKKTNVYNLSSFSPEHTNHETSYSAYWSDINFTEEQQKQYIDDMHFGLKCQASTVVRKIIRDTKKSLTLAQYLNWVRWRHPNADIRLPTSNW